MGPAVAVEVLTPSVLYSSVYERVSPSASEAVQEIVWLPPFQVSPVLGDVKLTVGAFWETAMLATWMPWLLRAMEDVCVGNGMTNVNESVVSELGPPSGSSKLGWKQKLDRFVGPLLKLMQCVPAGSD